MQPEIQCSGQDVCMVLQEMSRIYDRLRTEERSAIIKDLRKELDIKDCEAADDLKELGEAVISRMPELSHIPMFGVKIGYVRSYERKLDKGRTINADCRKVNKVYGAYLPFDFIVTFYEPNIGHMSENQRKILMLHELKHIGIGDNGFRIEPHDVEDFESILQRFGLAWNGFDQEVPDILAGGEDDQAQSTEKHKLATKRKASGRRRTPAES